MQLNNWYNYFLPLQCCDVRQSWLCIALGEDGKLVLKSLSVNSEDPSAPPVTTDVITFDNLGNAVFTGDVKAKTISAESISGLEVFTDKVSALTESVDGLEANIQSWATAESVTSLSGLVAGLSTTAATITAEQAGITNRLSTVEGLIPNLVTIDGLAPINGSLAALQESLRAQIALLESLDSRVGTLETQAQATTLKLEELKVGNGLSVAETATLSGGLTVNSITSFGDFLSLIGTVEFFGRPYFNADSGGFAVIRGGDVSAQVNFDVEYLEQPIVNATITQLDDKIRPIPNQIADAYTIFNNELEFLVAASGTKGFSIVLNKPAPFDVSFSWTALAVRHPKIFESSTSGAQPVPPTAPPVDSSPASVVTPEPVLVPDPSPSESSSTEQPVPEAASGASAEEGVASAPADPPPEVLSEQSQGPVAPAAEESAPSGSEASPEITP
jgi:hypothetical protein